MTKDEKKLCDIFSEISDKKNTAEIRLESKISELELDSLDIVEILMKIFEQFGVDIPIDTFLFCEDIFSIHREIIKSRV